jgi:hypothetical protein
MIDKERRKTVKQIKRERKLRRERRKEKEGGWNAAQKR